MNLDEFFPGSTTPLDFEARRKKDEEKIGAWDSKPLTFRLKGKDTEFFTIGHLAKALGDRSAITLRKWEAEGILPKSPYVKPSEDPRGRRRMYTREQVEGLVKIAREEGVLWPRKGLRLQETKFQERAHQLFRKLRSQ